MIVVQVTNNKNLDVDITLPKDFDEITLAQKIDYDVANEDLILFIKESLDKDVFDEQLDVYLEKLVKCIQPFTDKSINFFLEEVPSGLNAETLKKSLSIEEDEVIFNSSESTLVELYRYINNKLNSYKPKLFDKSVEIKHEGEVFILPHAVENIFKNGNDYSKLTTREVVEIMQVKKELSDFQKKLNKDNAFDYDSLADKRFSSLVKIISILLKPKNVEVPKDDISYEKYINNNMLKLQTLPLSTVYDLIFFLITTI